MARIKITLPERFHFSTKITIRVTDLNYGGHLGNDVVLSLVHEARMQYFQSLGYSEFDLGGASVIMADTAIVYKSEGFMNDELEIYVAAADFSRAGFDIYYKLVNRTKGKDLAWVKTGMVCFDYDERKVQPVPEEFRRKAEK